MGRPKGVKLPRVVALRLEADLSALLEQMAEEEERPLGVMARILVKEAMAARGKIPTEGKRKGKK